MCTLRRLSMAILLSTCVAQLATAEKVSKAKLRKAKRILAEVELVDGPGSGLNADTVRGLTPLFVVDSQGNFVGAVMVPDQCCPTLGALVVRRIGSTPVLFHVTAAGFDNNLDGPGALIPIASYESPDCSGTPLVAPQPSPFYPRTAGVAAATTAYYAGTTPATSRTVQSYSGDCLGGGTPLANGACCVPFPPSSDSFQEAVQFDLRTLGLNPPFHIDVIQAEPISTTTTTVAPR